MKYMLLFMFWLLCWRPLTGAEDAQRAFGTVEREIAAAAEAITVGEAAITVWDTKEKLALLADVRLLKLAGERDAASKRVAEIEANWPAAYKKDPQTKAWQKSVENIEKQLAVLGKTPDVEEQRKKLGAAKHELNRNLARSQPRLVPELALKRLQVQTRTLEIRQRLAEVLRVHPDGTDMMAAYDLALRRRGELDDEWLKLKGLTRPLRYLQSLTKPDFAKGHTLNPLTRYAYFYDAVDFQQEIAENWGFCVRVSGYLAMNDVHHCDSTVYREGQIVALVKSDPKRYKLQVVCNRGWPDVPPQETWTRNAAGTVLDGQAKSLDGTLWSPGMNALISPEAPDALWQECGRLRAEPIAALRKLCPIAMVLNGGEYGVGVLGFAKAAWQQDPKIEKARAGKPWIDYLSEQKAREEMLIATAVRAAAPDRELYIHYTLSGGGDRNRYGGWSDWGYEIGKMKDIADLASDEHYLQHFNTGYTSDPAHWGQGTDILRQALNAKGRNIAVGMPLSYSWLWASKRLEFDRSRWPGLLKMLYTTGMVGANVGNYNLVKDAEFNQSFSPDNPPCWLYEMVAAARVHAIFSHVERFIRAGDLMPGPDKHIYSKDQPAYEFPTGDNDARVVARKLRDKPEWLICAWAAGGTDRDVAVDIPELGTQTLQARANGTLYIATLTETGKKKKKTKGKGEVEETGKVTLLRLPQDDP